MSAQPEFRLQCVLVDYLALACPDLLWTAFPAGELRSKATAARVQRMGLKPGWPDIQMVLPGGVFVGLEIKAPKGLGRGAMSPAQVAIREAMTERGAYYYVVRSLDDLRAVLAFHGVACREVG